LLAANIEVTAVITSKTTILGLDISNTSFIPKLVLSHFYRNLISSTRILIVSKELSISQLPPSTNE
jgi:hypothetical protein